MTVSSSDNLIMLPAWLIRFCKWWWHKRASLFGIIFTIILNIVSALPLVDPATLHNLLIAWMFAHWYIFFSVFLLLCVLTILCGLIARLAAPLSRREMRRRYLMDVIDEIKTITLQGIPAELMPESVDLIDIFIPLQFWPNRPRVDYPLSERELERYRQELKSGTFTRDLHRLVFEAEQNWQHILKQSDRVGITTLWQQLKADRAIVIQGLPGIGKSTCMQRLALHMALRGLGRPDPQMLEMEREEKEEELTATPAHKRSRGKGRDARITQQKQLTPTLLPILLRLGEYASTREQTPDITLIDYLCQVQAKRSLPGLSDFIQQELALGNCLVMLDGLDEVSDPAMRQQVQEAIKACIHEHRGDESAGHYNCFIITSRVAGYDQAAFPDYPHFTITELTNEQIKYFLPRWYRAYLCREYGIRVQDSLHHAHLQREVGQRVRDMQRALTENQGVSELAENPLLLTLLMVMQQRGTTLPRRRVELYDVVTRTLLENRNIAKKIEPILETLAVQRLGPLAFQMQEANNSFALQRDVMEKLIEAIRLEGGTDEQVQAEAQRFLKRIRERSGLFAQRAGDYFSFMHRTFQEYFAARYILNQMKNEQERWINELVERACRQDELWREPFLLAVAYQSKENGPVADKILQALLAKASEGPSQEHIPHLLLAANAVIEAHPLAIDSNLEKRTAELLLASYERAQRTRAFSTCRQIEDVMLRWLLALPKEIYQSPLLAIISQSISDTQHVERQRATLTLLAMITPRLEPCSSAVFETIIPLLLALSGLPEIGPYIPAQTLVPSTNFDVSDLAIAILSSMGKRGPAGLYLTTLQNYFREHPEQLNILARCSLECGTLITPTLIPRHPAENYQCYESAIKQWIQLRDRHKGQVTPQEIAACATIHQTLLDNAQEAGYPIAMHLLAMLQRTAASSDEQSWSQIWQAYLLEQINAGSYMSYQQAALLWAALFPHQQHLQPLADNILKHYASDQNNRHQYAKRFTKFSIIHLRDLIYLRDLGDLGDLVYLRDLGDLGDLVYLRDLGHLRDLIIVESTAEKAYISLAFAANEQKVDAFIILMGYLLQVQENKQTGDTLEEKAQRFAQAALKELSMQDNDGQVRATALDVLRSLPTRTAREIGYVRQLVEETQDEKAREACLFALQRAQPVDDEAWQEMEKGSISPVEEVREVSAAFMKRGER